MQLHNKIIIAVMSLFILGSCSKSKLDEFSPSKGTKENLLTSETGFQYMLNGLYDEVRRYRSGDVYGTPNNIMNMQAMIGVDNAYGNRRDGYMDMFNYWGNYNANSTSSQAHYGNVWKWLYETINTANIIINTAEESNIAWTAGEKIRIQAEARCIRAWCYRHLTYLWGDVPLSLAEIKGENIRTDWDRTPVAEVREAMKQDWLFAEKNMPAISSVSDARLLKGVPQHYLAELYLQTGIYDSAKYYALQVTTNPSYALIKARYGVNATKPGTAYTDMFLDGNTKRSQGNTEALWVIQSELNMLGGEGNNGMRRHWVMCYDLITKKVGTKTYSPFVISADYGGRGLGRMAVTRWAYNLYAAGDDRGSDFAWRKYYTVNQSDASKLPPAGTAGAFKFGDTIFLNKTQKDTISFYDWPSTKKWDYASPLNTLEDRQYNDQILLRSAETYCLLAEACFRLGDNQGVLDALNALRSRAHAPLITGTVTLDAILDERSRELFSEEDRRYVLLRTRTWYDRTKAYNYVVQTKSTIQKRDTLLPIPQDVIDGNISKILPNNPGY